MQSEVEKRIEYAIDHESKTLTLRGLGISALPDTLTLLPQLWVLDITENSFDSLPEVIGELTQLRILRAGNNRISTLPPAISNLKQLRELHIADNGLQALPAEIGELERLQVLDFSGNRLKGLPLTLRNLSSLRKLYLHGNDLEIPTEILGQRTGESSNRVVVEPSTILEVYFRSQVGPTRPLNEAKLILVGRGEVGKTSLVQRLLWDRFATQPKTEGIQITPWEVELSKYGTIKLHVWDFGGQEIMHATHQFFLTERTVYLVVLNGREGGEDMDVEYWLRLIESFGGDSPVIVVLNKFDSHAFDLNRRGVLGKFPGRVRGFIETDCESGRGIQDLKDTICETLETEPFFRARFPHTWFAIKDYLSGMKENFISFERYREVCAAQGECDPASQEALASAMHCLGIALNYREDSRLRDARVLNPRWVTEGIYRILNSSRVAARRGELVLRELSDILPPQTYPSHMHEFLLSLMRRFDLCFRFPEPREDTYLIPQLLGKDQPDTGEKFAPRQCLNFQYTYPVFPEGLLPRFIVRTALLSVEQPRWRTGVVLEFEGNTALVKADAQERTVSINVSGPTEGRRRLLAVIRADFERIHADFPKLNPVASVPVPEHPYLVIPYVELRTYERQKVTEFTRVVGDDVIRLSPRQLLSSVDPTFHPGTTVRVFISYSHKDETFLHSLLTQLKLLERSAVIDKWYDHEIRAGREWMKEIDRHLEIADLVLLLISADYIVSDFCDKEMNQAMQLHGAGKAWMVPIIVRECSWQTAPFGKLSALPKNGRPIKNWPDRDSAWRNVASELETIVDEIRRSKAGRSPGSSR